MVFDRCYKLMMITIHGLCFVDNDDPTNDVNEEEPCESDKMDRVDLAKALLE